MNEDFDFDKLEADIDATKIALEEMAKIMAPMFKSFVKAGLTGAEAAALTAAFWQQQLPVELQGPQEGS